MKNLKIFMLAALLFSAAAAHAQLVVPGTSVEFRLDNEQWRYLRTMELTDGGSIYLYCYVGEVVLDLEGDTVLPFLRIYVNPDYDGDVYELAYDRYLQNPFQSLQEYTHGDGIPRKNGLGYRGAYTNPSDQKDYQFLMTYFKDRGTIVEFRLETTKDTFREMEPMFQEILKSLK